MKAGVRYGPLESQEADLHLPDVHRPPVVCLLHGGFWRMPYGRDQLTAVAEDLSRHGLAVWNLEYGRLGGPRGRWPSPVEDVEAGIHHLARLAEDGVDLDLDRVALVGHSAGGQLALCAAARWPRAEDARPARLSAVVGLAPVADLAAAHETGVGGGVIGELLGGSPREVPDLYRSASPAERIPLGVRQLIVHGTADDVVPIDLSRRYAQAARAAGDAVELVELARAGHMEFLDPESEAFGLVRRWLLACLGGG